MLWTRDEIGEIDRLRWICMVLAKTFAAIVGDLPREDLVLEYFTTELKYDRNDVEQIVVIVVFDPADEGVHDPFDDRLTVE